MRTRTRFLIATSAAVGVIAAAAGWTNYTAQARHHASPAIQNHHDVSQTGEATD